MEESEQKIVVLDEDYPCKDNELHNDVCFKFPQFSENDCKNEGMEHTSGVNDVADFDSGKKGGLMKRLTSLLSKKSSVKPSIKAAKQVATAGLNQQHQGKHALQASSEGDVKHSVPNFENLLAQAEATLGEMLVKAGRGGPSLFKSMSRTAPANFNGAMLSLNPRKPGSTFSSRLWQHVGGKIFCGASSSGAAMPEVMPVAMPEHQKCQEEEGHLYFGDDSEPVDEVYWQEALAEALRIHGNDSKAVVNGGGFDGEHAHQQLSSVDDGVSEIREEIEILPSMPGCVLMGGNSSRMGVSFDSSKYNLRESMRLNTRLEDSPHLIQNYSSKLMPAAPIHESSSLSSSLWTSLASTSALSHSSSSLRIRTRSSSVLDGIGQKYLLQPRDSSSSLLHGPTPRPASSTSMEESSSIVIHQASSSIGEASLASRVSLQTLLYEEKEERTLATVPSISASEASQQMEATKPQMDVEGSSSIPFSGPLGDPLLCCVCLVNKKGAAFIPCGHTFCRSCTKQLFAGRGACPLCNNPIAQVLDIF